MDSVDPAILRGTNPEWRVAWEGGLDAQDRARVQECVREGTKMPDPRLEPFVIGWIARARRGVRTTIAVQVILVAALIPLTIVAHSHGASVIGLCLLLSLVLSVTVIPWRIRNRFRELDRAERAQATG